MDRIRIRGGSRLRGEIQISGAKNAALPLMAAALLTAEPLRLANVPDLVDIVTMTSLLSQLGAAISVAESPFYRRSSGRRAYRSRNAVGIDQHTGLGATLAGAFRDNRRDGLVRKIRRDAVRWEQTLGVGLDHERSGAER